MEKWAGEKPASSEEEPCRLGSRRKVNYKVNASTQDSEPQPQEPYLRVLEEPPPCASGLEAGGSSKMQEPLGSPENMAQLRPAPVRASSLHLCSASPPAAPAPETKLEERAKQGQGSLPKPETGPSQNTSSSTSPTSGLRFSLLKGQRQAPGPPEKASLQPDRPWKVLRSPSSPTTNRAKSVGKGKVSARSAGRGCCSLDVTRRQGGAGRQGRSPSELAQFRGFGAQVACGEA